MTYAASHIVTAIRVEREKQGISQRELSAKAGVPQAQISRFESGVVDLRLSSLVSLARALGLELELIPKKAAPAVETIVRTTQNQQPRADASTRAALKEISKLTETLQTIRLPQIPTTQIEQALTNLRMLERIRIPVPEIQAIKDLSKTLAQIESFAIDPKVFAQHARAIQDLRNTLVDAPAPALAARPAYALNEEEDSDA